MAKSSNQKLKLMYLRKILLEYTDDNHSLSMADILSMLGGYGITAERKSIYDDLECLRRYGMDIIQEQRDRGCFYHVGNRDFELPELKLLVDSVQSSKFITTKKSNQLIKKIEGLASRYEAGELQSQVYVTERVKNMNESIYLNVDCINSAIAANRMIEFQYFQWNVKKKAEIRHGKDHYYRISPWALLWDDENYYMVGYDSEAQMVKHYRVDKMLRIRETDVARKGKDVFKKSNMAVYAKKMFGMYGGSEEDVSLRCENRLAGAVIDRFGRDIIMIPKNDGHFNVTVRVAVSRQFIHWVMALEGAVITGPERVVDMAKEEIKRLINQYGD